MSLPSIHDLEKRFADLTAKFLEPEIAKEIQGSLPDADQIASFRLLMHAELEDFLERTARHYIELRIFQVSSIGYTPTAADFSLILVTGTEIARVDGTSYFETPAILDALNGALLSAKKLLSENNGVKKESLSLFANCCGLLPDHLDSTLVATLTSFGKERGDVAHKAVSRVSSIRSPSDEKATVEQILRDLRASTPWSSGAQKAHRGIARRLLDFLKQW